MVDCTALEMRRTGNRTVGSNPTLSATAQSQELLFAVGSAILGPSVGRERPNLCTGPTVSTPRIVL